MVCAAGTPNEGCKAIQRLAAPDGAGGQNVVFAVNVVRATRTASVAGRKPTQSAAPSLVMILSAPLGGYLVPGVELKLDGRALARLLFETCNGAGCHGGFVLTPAYRRAFERAKTMQARLWVGKAKPVDVTGLAAALSALEARDTLAKDAR